jgi:hypothetical protein
LLCAEPGPLPTRGEVREALESVARAERGDGEPEDDWFAIVVEEYLDVAHMIADHEAAGVECEWHKYCTEEEREIPGLVVKLLPWIESAPADLTAEREINIPVEPPLTPEERAALPGKLAELRKADAAFVALWDAATKPPTEASEGAERDTAVGAMFALGDYLIDVYGFTCNAANAALRIRWGTVEPENAPRVPAGNRWSGLIYIRTEKGIVRPLLANAELAFRKEWSGVLAYDEFRMCVTTLKEPPRFTLAKEAEWAGSKPGEPWTDNDDRLAAIWLQRAECIHVSDEVAGKAIQVVAREHRIHPVRSYLCALRWDGTIRLNDWLTTYLGAKPSAYTRAVGKRWLIAAIARIFRPGCKADCCFILEGPQGARKSTAIRTIAAPWFTDEIAELGSKDAALQARGVWIIELSELDAMSGADVAKVKSFMSRASDRFRPPYGRQVIEAPRQCVFAGTVNHSAYLKDETGGRRFWPVKCGEIKIDDLARDRDQLLAEALVRYRAGDVWWLETQELNELATLEQGDRYQGDAWDEIIALWVESPCSRPDDLPFYIPLRSTPESVCIPEILYHAIGKRPETWTQVDKNRVARSLRSLGYERYKRRGDHDKFEWCYRKKGDTEKEE